MVLMKEDTKFLKVVEHWLYKMELSVELATYHFVLIVKKAINSYSNNQKEIFVVEKEIISDQVDDTDRNYELACFEQLEQAVRYAAQHYPPITND